MDKVITKIDKEMEKVIDAKVAIMIEILMVILNCSYSDAYKIVRKSKTYRYLTSLDYATLHDSPQANLSSIGQELRSCNIDIGNVVTDENIKKAMLHLRDINLKQKV